MILFTTHIELDNPPMSTTYMDEATVHAYDVAEAVGKFMLGEDGEWERFLQGAADDR